MGEQPRGRARGSHAARGGEARLAERIVRIGHGGQCCKEQLRPTVSPTNPIPWITIAHLVPFALSTEFATRTDRGAQDFNVVFPFSAPNRPAEIGPFPPIGSPELDGEWRCNTLPATHFRPGNTREPRSRGVRLPSERTSSKRLLSGFGETRRSTAIRAMSPLCRSYELVISSSVRVSALRRISGCPAANRRSCCDGRQAQRLRQPRCSCAG